MRVLIDYRPALRQRSGSASTPTSSRRALLAMTRSAAAPCAFELTLFSSSWKDRLAATPDIDGAAIVDRRVPVRALNFAWHRLGWPPAEALAGGAFDVVHSPHPLLMPARRAAQVITIHDLNFLTHPARTSGEIRRDYPALVREHAHRAGAILVPSAYTAGEIERLLGVPRERMALCPPGAPDWTPRAAAPKDGYVLFFSTLEPRKNVSGLLDAYERLLRDGLQDVPDTGGTTEPPSGRSGTGPRGPRDTARRSPGSIASIGRRSRAACATSATSTPTSARASVRRRPASRATLLRRRVRPAGAGSDDARRAGGRRGSRIAAGSARRRGRARRPRSPEEIAAAIARVLSDEDLAADVRRATASRDRARFRWDDDRAPCVPGLRARDRAPGAHRAARVTMRIGIDARELGGRVTGVGRYLAGLLHEWSADAQARQHEFVLYAHEPIALSLDARRFPTRTIAGSGGTWWEQVQLPRTAHGDHLDVWFAPAYTAPLRIGIATVVAIHDLSFVAHPEWFTLREGVRRRWVTNQSARRASAVITISEFSKRELIERLAVPAAKIHVIPPGVSGVGAGAGRVLVRRALGD